MTAIRLRKLYYSILYFTCFLLVPCVLSPTALNAQVAGGSITGRIMDSTGAVIAGSPVTVKNLDTDIVRELKTNNDGIYTAPNLQPGNYELVVSPPGFKKYVYRVEVKVGATQLIDATLSVGDASQQVEVTGAAQNAVELTTSTISAAVDANTIRELPLNGRSWTDLAILQPGVLAIKLQLKLADRAQHGFGTVMTIAGGRPQQNTYRLNGISINDYSNAAPGSVIGISMGVDAIQEFSVLTGNYSAQYGRTSGGVINAVTRSGSNQLHGSAYEFLRNSALDAKNYFDKTIPPFKRNQFGASIGGPIVKDRTFFFADYEGLRQSLGISTPSVVPSAAARAGNLAAGPVAVDPAVTRFLNAFYPLPNSGVVGNGDTGIFLVSGQQIAPENYWTVRGDHRFSEHDSLNAVYLHEASETTQPDEFNQKRILLPASQQVATLEESHTFSSHVLNSLRVGYTRSTGEDGGVTSAINPLMSDVALGFVPGVSAGRVTISGLTDFSGGVQGAFGPGIAAHRYVHNSIQAYDDLIWSLGKHQLSLGANFEDYRANNLVTSFAGGQFMFTTLANFLTNKPFSVNFTGHPESKLTERGIRQRIFGTYIHDDWRLHRNLTVNLGLRYEMATVPTEQHGKLSTLRNMTDTTPHLGDPFFKNPTLRNFEPRVGLAWDPFGTGKTSIRSAFGIFDVLPLPYLFQTIFPFATPFFEQANATNVPAGGFPTGSYQFVVANLGPTLRMSFVQPDPGRNYVMTWNLNVQRELSRGVSATVAYVGSRGVHQPWTNNDGDMVIPTKTSQGYVWPAKATSQRINTTFGRIAMKLWITNSFYHSMQARLTAQGHGARIQASYTWAKSIDNSSASESDNSFTNSIGNPYWFAPETNRGRSDFDVRHTLVINSMWAIPAPRFANSPASGLLFKGWSLGGIYSANTGPPFNMFLAGDPLGTKGNANSELPNRVVGPGCDTLTTSNPLAYVKTECIAFPNPANVLGNIGRNVFTGPSLSNLDVMLLKDTHLRKLSERLTMQFRVETFNVLNHANFAPPTNNATAFDGAGNRVATAGRIDSLVTPARQIQFGLKFLW
jgi:hypothetical protein